MPTRPLSDLLPVLGKHLVGLFVRVKAIGQDGLSKSIQDLRFAGVVLHVRGEYLYLTAGHILRALDENLSSGTYEYGCAYLVDIFGKDAEQHPVPFDLKNMRMYYLVKERKGLDFGLMFLGSYYTRLLKANGIVPVEKRHWQSLTRNDYTELFVSGFPQELNPVEHVAGKQTSISATIQRLEPLSAVPESIDPGHRRRFFGRVPPGTALDFKGMSGGPVFGFKAGLTTTG